MFDLSNQQTDGYVPRRRESHYGRSFDCYGNSVHTSVRAADYAKYRQGFSARKPAVFTENAGGKGIAVRYRTMDDTRYCA